MSAELSMTIPERNNMPRRLGELLIDENLLTSVQLDEAIEAQCLYGGRLGTNLIDMGYIDEGAIAHTLSRKLNLPYIEPALLMKIPPQVINLVPQQMAWKHLVIPCRLEHKRLYLAMADPTDLGKIDELGFRLGYVIVPVVVPEIRLMLALQKYYHLELSPRFQSMSKRLLGNKKKTSAKTSKKNTRPVKDSPKSGTLDDFEAWPLLGDDEAGLEELSDEEYQELVNLPSSLRLEPDSTVPVAPTVAPQKVTEEERNLINYGRQLTEANDRDDIAAVLLTHMKKVFAASGIFMVKGGQAIGWCASESKAEFEQLQFPLHEPTVLKLVAEDNSYYLGPLPNTAPNNRISAHFGGSTPPAVLLIPLRLCGRLVSIIYVQDQIETLQQHLLDMQQLVNKSAMAFEMLILKNKILMN